MIGIFVFFNQFISSVVSMVDSLYHHNSIVKVKTALDLGSPAGPNEGSR